LKGIRKGSTIEDTPEKRILKEFVHKSALNKDHTATCASAVGPGHYNSNHNLVKKNAHTSMTKMAFVKVGDNQKKALKDIKLKRFDGSGATIKKADRYLPADLK
jgi:hypothetical protein